MKVVKIKLTQDLEIFIMCIVTLIITTLIGYFIECVTGISAVGLEYKDSLFAHVIAWCMIGTGFIIMSSISLSPFIWIYQEIQKSRSKNLS